MPIPKSVSKCSVDLSRLIVKIVILNPSNEAPIPIWVTLGLRDIAVFTFPSQMKRSHQITTLQAQNSMKKRSCGGFIKNVAGF